MSFKRVSVAQTKELIDGGDITIIDIRDSGSYSIGHIDKAIHADDINMEAFVVDEDKKKPLIIYCYHGNSSQSAAGYFVENGFSNVYSLDGGYSAWPQD
jgi:thiosulfate sulfurtransferase